MIALTPPFQKQSGWGTHDHGRSRSRAVVQYGAGTYHDLIVVHTVVGDFVDVTGAIYG